MKVQHYILATAGHVDHGKSALVKALTGTDPDRLPEEKARGITIDLGFAFLELAAPGMTYDVGIIDVPGHEDFVKNMVAGMGAIDAAMLVVAADDGWMPQTQEHLDILNYLGVRHGVVAITKSDLGGAASVAEDVRRRLRGTRLAEAAIVETSAKTGAGLTLLRTALVKTLEATPAPRDIGKPRLRVDRVFSLRGLGTVVTGTLAGGMLTRGQTLTVQPGGKVTRARTLQTHGRDVTHALPGMRTAINLPDVAPGEVKRGDVIVESSAGPAAEHLVAALWRLGGEVALRDGVRVHVHIGSAEVPAKVQWTKHRAAGQLSIARLRLETPVFASLGERLVVRDWPARETVAGGIVVDLAPRRGWHLREQGLLRRAASVEDAAAWVETEVAWELALPAAGLLAQSRFSAAEVEAAVEKWVARGVVQRVGAFLVEYSWWEGLRRQVVEIVASHHRARPQDRGIALTTVQEQLRQGGKKGKISGDVLSLLAAGMGELGFVTAGGLLTRKDYAPVLPAGLQRAGESIRLALRIRPFDPPSKKELVQQAGAGGMEAMAFLVQTGAVVALGDEAVMGSEAFDEAGRRIQKELEARGKATVSELKTLLRTSRRIAVPLLEVMDARGVTARRGDVRVLGRTTAG